MANAEYRSKKKFVINTKFILLCCTAALVAVVISSLLFSKNPAGDSFEVGKSTIIIAPPHDYIRILPAEFPIHTEQFRINLLPENEFMALYTTAGIRDALLKEDGISLDEYAVCFYFSFSKDIQVSKGDFSTIKNGIQEHAKNVVKDEKIAELLEKRISDHSKGNARLGELVWLGDMQQTDKYIIYTMLIDIVDGQSKVKTLATSSVTFLRKGKVVAMNFYRVVKSETDVHETIEKAKEYARNNL